MNFLEEFRRVIHGLEARGVEYAVVGGWALAFHGVVRATDDIDLLIVTESVDEARQVALELGFIIQNPAVSMHGGRIQLQRVSRPEPDWVDGLLVLDFLLVTPDILDVWDGRERISTGFGEVSVVSLEGFVKLKQISGRAKDLADVEALLDVATGLKREPGLPATATGAGQAPNPSRGDRGDGGYQM